MYLNSQTVAFFYSSSKVIHILYVSTFITGEIMSNNLIPHQQCVPASNSFFLLPAFMLAYTVYCFVLFWWLCYFIEFVVRLVIPKTKGFYGNTLMIDGSFIFGLQGRTMNFLFLLNPQFYSTNKTKVKMYYFMYISYKLRMTIWFFVLLNCILLCTYMRICNKSKSLKRTEPFLMIFAQINMDITLHCGLDKITP